MNYKIIITDKALSDIDEIGATVYQASQSIITARNFINRIYKTIQTLETFPLSGSNPRNRALLLKGYKFLVHEKYMIFYKFEADSVYIISVFNGKKDYFKYYNF